MATAPSTAWEAEDKGPTSLGIILSVTVLSTLFAAARIFVRGKMLGKIYLDDYLIIASVVSRSCMQPTLKIPQRYQLAQSK